MQIFMGLKAVSKNSIGRNDESTKRRHCDERLSHILICRFLLGTRATIKVKFSKLNTPWVHLACLEPLDV